MHRDAPPGDWTHGDPDTPEEDRLALLEDRVAEFLGDREKELATFRALVDLQGENTERGLNAVFAVGWTLASRENYEEGRRMMEKVIAGPEANPNDRLAVQYAERLKSQLD